MATFMIDTENVSDGWEMLFSQNPGNTYLLFYTNPAIRISYSLLEKILNSPSTTKCILCNKGPNGLDFQLVSELGFRLATRPEEMYIIVSNDGGYDAAIKYWIEKGYAVSRQKIDLVNRSIPEQAIPKVVQPSNPQSSANQLEQPVQMVPVTPETPPQQNAQNAKKKKKKKAKAVTQVVAQTVAKSSTATNANKPKSATAKRITQILSGIAGITNAEKNEITNLCESVASLPLNNRLLVIYNGLTSKYGTKHGLSIYKKAKKEIKAITKTL